MNKKYKNLTKNVGLFAVSNFGSKIISFLFVPLYTYYLSTADYGMVDLISTTVSLLIPVLTINIQDAVLRFSLDKNKNSKQILGIGLRINLYANTIFIIGLFLLQLLGILHLSSLYCFFTYISFSCGALNNSLQMYLKAEDKVFVLTISSLLQTLIVCVGNIITLSVLKIGIEGYLITSIVGYLLPIVVMFIFGKILPIKKSAVDNSIKKEMIAYSMPLIINSVSWWINNASDRYILTYISGVAVNGIYSISYKIPTILSTVQSIFYNAWSISAITEFDKDDSDGFFGNAYSFYSFLCLFFFLFIIVLNKPISKILFSGEFFTAWKYVPILLIATLFNGLALFQGCMYTAIKKTKIISQTTIIGAVVNTIMNFILIYYFSAIGAAIATLLGYLTTWSIRTIMLRKHISMKVNWTKEIFLYTIVCVEAILATIGNFEIVCWSIVGIIVLINKDLIIKFANIFKKITRKNKY